MYYQSSLAPRGSLVIGCDGHSKNGKFWATLNMNSSPLASPWHSRRHLCRRSYRLGIRWEGSIAQKIHNRGWRLSQATVHTQSELHRLSDLTSRSVGISTTLSIELGIPRATTILVLPQLQCAFIRMTYRLVARPTSKGPQVKLPDCPQRI